MSEHHHCVRTLGGKTSRRDGGATVALFHSHGVGPFDYSSIRPGDLSSINEIAERRNWLLCPTLYVRRGELERLRAVFDEYSHGRVHGQYTRILGFAIEGPLLGPKGGIPRGASWRPSEMEWRAIAALGSRGLRYIVMAPDIMDLDESIEGRFTFSELLMSVYDSGIRIAMGHFVREHPELSARRVEAVLGFLHQMYGDSPDLVLTDHLFNDMPRNFTHAWRTKQDRTSRERELREVVSVRWEDGGLEQVLGPVPAMLIAAARSDRLAAAMNFDGVHVDLAICRKTLEYIGSHRLIPMTDDTEVPLLAGEQLQRSQENGLLYRDDGVVAVGSSGYEAQRSNLLGIGLTEAQVDYMFGDLIVRVLAFSPVRTPGHS